MLANALATYQDENGITRTYQSPIQRWKETIGLKDPGQNKADNPNSLRILYGVDIIRNEFWGSDSRADSYRELSIFKLPIPAKVYFSIYRHT